MELEDFKNSIILVDKPTGITSSKTLNAIKKVSKVKKVGHSGTLDKFASGLLVVCTGTMTKLTRFFLDDDKKYHGLIKLGTVTDTDDREGAIVEQKSIDHISEKDIIKAIESFTGEIAQMPPLYSALKINGKRASDLARKGETVSLKERIVTIYDIKINEIDLKNFTISIDVHCSKGTYIRSLARDIGNKLRTGAFLQELRRTESGLFSIKNAVTIDELNEYNNENNERKPFIIEPIEALSYFSQIDVDDEARKRIVNGAYFNRENVTKITKREEKKYIIVDRDKIVIAIADIDLEKWHIDYDKILSVEKR